MSGGIRVSWPERILVWTGVVFVVCAGTLVLAALGLSVYKMFALS